MLDQPLIDWVNKVHDAGITYDELKLKLEKRGYASYDIAEAMRYFEALPYQAPPLKESNHIVAVIACVVLVAALAGGALSWYHFTQVPIAPLDEAPSEQSAPTLEAPAQIVAPSPQQTSPAQSQNATPKAPAQSQNATPKAPAPQAAAPLQLSVLVEKPRYEVGEFVNASFELNSGTERDVLVLMNFARQGFSDSITQTAVAHLGKAPYRSYLTAFRISQGTVMGSLPYFWDNGTYTYRVLAYACEEPCASMNVTFKTPIASQTKTVLVAGGEILPPCKTTMCAIPCEGCRRANQTCHLESGKCFECDEDIMCRENFRCVERKCVLVT